MISRTFLTGLALIANLLAVAPASAQGDKTLRVLVGFPAGVSIDVVTRILTDKMKDELKRPVIVDNRPGAGGRLAAELLKSAAPDGNTVMITPIVVPVLAPMVFSKLSYNPDMDFAPVGKVCDFSFALAVPANAPVKTLKDYAEWLKANPNQANFGSPAAGSLPHFFGVMIGSALNVDMVHVPYKGSTPMLADLMGGQVDMAITIWAGNLPATVAEGKVKVIGLAARTPLAKFPQIPALAAHPRLAGFEFDSWAVIAVPRSTPDTVANRLNKAVYDALQNPDIRSAFEATGNIVVPQTSVVDLDRVYRDEVARYQAIARSIRFEPQ